MLDTGVEAALCAAALACGCGVGLGLAVVVVVAVVAVVVVDVVVVDWAAAAGAAVWLEVDEAEPHALTISVSTTAAVGMRRCLIGCLPGPPEFVACLKGRRSPRVASRESGPYGCELRASRGRIPPDLNNR